MQKVKQEMYPAKAAVGSCVEATERIFWFI